MDKKKQQEVGSNSSNKAPKEAFFPTKDGSVFPLKKKLVKRMVFDCLVHSTTANKQQTACSCFLDCKKSKPIFPNP
ncbi:hypothetical protein JCGZ_12178 [Jatropha curcas]|uniref:Uncharacterized protein n=1 Tax=Jatropha curcas TaxID=180498 RepID=A0A067K9H7_JATCU|nr:hypothetical protein JCGZ_12178 [Jatropha curcas]